MATKSVHSNFPVLALLVGATLWGVVWYPMRLLEGAGLSSLWLTTWLFLASAVAGGVLAWRYRHWFGRRPWLLACIAISAGWANLAFILAILDGNIMRVLFLFYLSPVWAVLLGWLFLKEHISVVTIGVLVVAVIGGAMMLWQPGESRLWPDDAADWLALSSGFAFAVSNIFIRYGQEIPVRIKALSSWIGVVFIVVIFILVQQPPVPQVGIGVYVGVVALAWFGLVAMTLLVQFGVSHMPVHRSAIILLFELVAGAISQQLLTTESMTMVEWVGGGLVVVAAALTALRERDSV
ncbi:MAG: DMT family transporter [Acidiferrobacterales bacterium]